MATLDGHVNLKTVAKNLNQDASTMVTALIVRDPQTKSIIPLTERCFRLRGGPWIPTESGRLCDCTDHFYGTFCENKDACFDMPCEKHQTCILYENSTDKYSCKNSVTALSISYMFSFFVILFFLQ